MKLNGTHNMYAVFFHVTLVESTRLLCFDYSPIMLYKAQPILCS